MKTYNVKRRADRKKRLLCPVRYSLSAIRCNSRGSVLITVVWILSFLAIFTLAINRRVTQELLMGSWIRDRVVTRVIAKAGVERVIFEVKQDEFLSFDTLNEAWASNEVAFKEVPLGDGELIVSCSPQAVGKESSIPSEKEEDIRYGACDESGKLNINYANESQLKDLVMLIQEEPKESDAFKIAHAIIDWRDEDNSVMAFGAEDNYYKATLGKALPRNEPFQTVEELKMIRDVDEDLFLRLEPYVTVYTQGAVNFNTASSIVLQALGLHPDLAEKLVEFRKGEDLISGNEDDQVFQVVEGITPTLSAALPFSPEEFAQINNLIGLDMVGVSSDAFRIRSYGRFIKNRGFFNYEISCVIDRTGEILYWQEDSFITEN